MAEKIRFEFHELDVAKPLIVEVSHPKEVASFVEQFTKSRNWRRVDDGAWSARLITHVAFVDKKGSEFWWFQLVGNTLEFRGSDDQNWEASWPNGTEWVTKMTKVNLSTFD